MPTHTSHAKIATKFGIKLLRMQSFFFGLTVFIGTAALKTPAFLKRSNKAAHALFMDQLYEHGPGVLPAISLFSILLGSILSIFSITQFQRYGFHLNATATITTLLSRQICSLLVAIVLIATAGVKYTTRLGLNAQDRDITIEGNVVPKILATLLAAPCLYIYSASISIFSTFMISTYMFHISPFNYIQKVVSVISFSNILISLIKSTLYGSIIGVMACYYGMQTAFGKMNVARSIKYTFIQSFVFILITNVIIEYLLTKLGL